ncbi:MAG TPA: TonB-dependent receptor [Flavisolibacter sp.]|jgi:TonB-linked SusC/RagA family outer membrane protein|nr:TonB-dependent receptor [Flavisolibacter sp.]
MRKLHLLLAMLMLTMSVLAQQKTITGTVINKSTNQPVEGATVQSKKNSAVTDQGGKFTIQATVGETITVTHIGMSPQSFRVGNGTQIDIALEEANADMERVVVVGYKSERKKDITGAVSVVNVNETVKESNVNILSSLQGRVPGVQINNDGTPGGTGFNVIIRGFSSTRGGGPLYIIDGVGTTNPAALNPNDIESIQVLKDAASATIYGARANNGVIVITTKSGKSPKTQITFHSYVGQQMLANRIHMLNTKQYGEALWQAYAYSGLTPSHSVYGNGPTPVAAPYIDPGQTMATANTDWLDAIYHNSTIQSYNLSLNKSSDRSSFFLGMNYSKDEGIQKYSNYDQFSTRLNSNFSLNKSVSVGENLQVSNYRQLNFGVRAMNDAVFQFPFIPIYDKNGNFGGPWAGDQSDKRSPLGELYNGRNNRGLNWRIFGNVYGNAEIIPGLNFKTSLGVDYTTFYLRNFAPTYVEGSHGNPIASLTTSQNFRFSYTWTNTLNYHMVANRHVFDLFGGIEAIKNRQESSSGSNTGFIINDYNYAYLAGATGIATATGTAAESALLSQFGKFNYAFADRYLFSATVRRDGSSRFGQSQRYGVFPAFSAGWRLNNESFLSPVRQINDLKLRGSWGQTGNQEIGDYNTVDFFRTNGDQSNYNLAGTPTGSSPGYYASQRGNPNLKWEAQTQTDIGLDFLGFSNHISASVDWYKKVTSNLLISPPLLAVAGIASAPFVNSGKIENTGIEYSVGYQNTFKSGLRFNADFNMAFNKNKVLELTKGVPYITNTYGLIQPGHEINEFYGYVADGIFQSQKEVDDYKTKVTSGDFQAKPGRIRYKDLNGDGKIDANDRTFIGKPNPKFNYGLNLSASFIGFDASVFLSGVYGNKIFNEFRKYSELGIFPSNYSVSVLNAWTPTNTSATVPALQKTLTNNEGRTSSYFVEDGSYLKIKSIQIGYSLPKRLIRRIGSNNVRFYVQGENLFTFTKYSGMDPESVSNGTTNKGVDFQGMLYPHTKAVNFGLDVNF